MCHYPAYYGIAFACGSTSEDGDEAMRKAMYVQLAPIELRDGVDESTLLAASDTFQANFVSRQPGITKRVLLRRKHGGYADLVFFASKDDAERVARLEETSQECRDFGRIMKAPDKSLPDMGVLSFEHVKTYE
jgi:hypothetical protein